MSAQLDSLLDRRRLDQCKAADAALLDTIRDAVAARSYRSAQRAYDDRTDDRADRDELAEARDLIESGAATARAEQAMEEALYERDASPKIRTIDGHMRVADVVATLLSAEDLEVNALLLVALRHACVNWHPNTADQHDKLAAQALRRVAEMLCSRFAAAHGSAYVRRQA